MSLTNDGLILQSLGMINDSISFARALSISAEAPRHLLLGNGFSIGAHPAFGYPNLFNEAVRIDPTISTLFPDPENPNFEDALEQAEDPADAVRIRAALIRAVTDAHPFYSLSLDEDKRQSCREFLENFAGRELAHPGCIFTTNYDLLLHWIVSTQPAKPGSKPNKPLRLWDGFETGGQWREHGDARIFYLHGAVHIHEEAYNERRRAFRTWMLRYEFKRPLMTQVNALLATGRFPVFVAEGTASAKIASLREWPYLKRARRILQKTCNQEQGAIFTFGHSLGKTDEHIISVIGYGKIATVYLGVFGDRDRQRAVELIDIWTTQRSEVGHQPPKVFTYDARECSVWTTKAATTT